MQTGERKRDEKLHTPSRLYFAGLGVSVGEEPCQEWMLSSYGMWVTVGGRG